MTSNIRTSLSAFAESMRDPDPDGAWKLAQSLWNEAGIVVLVPSDVERKRGWLAAKQTRVLAENCFGKRNGKGA
jgi:hypothetical protein